VPRLAGFAGGSSGARRGLVGKLGGTHFGAASAEPVEFGPEHVGLLLGALSAGAQVRAQLFAFAGGAC
jgi:hypothetical protein